MSYSIVIYDWSLYTLPAAIPITDIEGDTHANDPASVDYDPGAPSWIGETFTFNGGTSTPLLVTDDDANFEDVYVETGGAQTLTQDVTINGTTYLAGSVVENEFSMLDGSGNEVWVVRIDGVNVGFAYPSGSEPTAGDTFTGVVGRDGDPLDSGDGVASSETYQNIECFTPGALIETPDGPRPVESLEVGELVQTADHGAQPIRWISRRRVEFSNGPEDAKPIQIKKSAFGTEWPTVDLIVSPQHRFIVIDQISGNPVFVAAKALTVLPGVRLMKGKKHVEYIHLALDAHQVLFANGLQTESCYLGPVVLNDLGPATRRHLKRIFPSVEFDPGRGYGPLARPAIRVQRARALLSKGHLVPAGTTASSARSRPNAAMLSANADQRS